MSFFNQSFNKEKKLKHLIIGGGYVAEFHIRASICNKFEIFLIEPDLLKREYLNYLFPEINTFENIQNFFKLFNKEKIDLLSILLPPNIRHKAYETIPKIDCITIIEKPLTKFCIKKFNNEQTFLGLNLSYNFAGKYIINNSRKFENITSIKTWRPSPGNLLRQNSIKDYLLDFLPHTLTPLNLIFSHLQPTIKYEYSNYDSAVYGKFYINKKEISFEICISPDKPDTVIKLINSNLSFDNSLIEIDKTFTPLRNLFNQIYSIIDSRSGYGTMYYMYKDFKNYIKYNYCSPTLDSLKIYKTKYIIFNK